MLPRGILVHSCSNRMDSKKILHGQLDLEKVQLVQTLNFQSFNNFLEANLLQGVHVFYLQYYL